MRNLIYLISISFTIGCQTTPTLRMLDKKADYESERDVRVSLGQDFEGGHRQQNQTATIFIHAHETATDAYFHGGYLTIRLNDQSDWFEEAAKEIKTSSPIGLNK